MNFSTLVDNLISDTVEVSLPLFVPELIVCATIVVLLTVRVFRLAEGLLLALALAALLIASGNDWLATPDQIALWIALAVLVVNRLVNTGRYSDPFVLALVGSLLAWWFAVPDGLLGNWTGVERQEIFTGMLVYDSFTVFFRMFLLAFAAWFVVLVRMTGLADREDGQDFYTLLLGATLGMCLMASANHLMTIFLAVEMASVPSYVMSGILKGRRRASEAALKYAVYGAGAAGVMLYGISLLAGLLGTAHLPTIAARLAEMDIPSLIASGESGGTLMVLALSALMIMVGLAFKLSAVPFHFWCPDVFEGASAEVDAFLSVASKAAAMALLVRVALGVSTAGEVNPEPPVAHRAVPAQAVSLLLSPDGEAASDFGELSRVAAAAPTLPTNAKSTPLSPVRSFIVQLLAVVAAVTCTFGNLTAYGQTNIKRLLAYSTIAHAGYMMMAVAAAVQLAGDNPDGARTAVAALVFYLGVYVFMNLGAFAIVAFLRNAIGSEEIADYSGLIRSAPVTSVMLTIIMISLLGLPPLAGFFGKLLVFYALVAASGPWMIALLVIAGINTVISLIYYLRVAKTVCIDPEPAARGPLSIGGLPAAYVFIVALPVVIYGIYPVPVQHIAEQASKYLLM
ncbi:MAG: NADH-quinone oxidoreductase subunit N [Planctomycetes bacterium]|nr:NADH-quinone oxidoreductase subunit N [Planctomycetota bacterium]